MPPKKIIKLDPKQHTLLGLLGQQKQTDTNSKASKSETGDLDDNSQTEPTPTSSDKPKNKAPSRMSGPNIIAGLLIIKMKTICIVLYAQRLKSEMECPRMQNIGTFKIVH